MIVDASAILAVLFDEPEKADFRDLLLMTPELVMSPVNYLEARFVPTTGGIGRKGLNWTHC